jgi:hypothetical protein
MVYGATNQKRWLDIFASKKSNRNIARHGRLANDQVLESIASRKRKEP